MGTGESGGEPPHSKYASLVGELVGHRGGGGSWGAAGEAGVGLGARLWAGWRAGEEVLVPMQGISQIGRGISHWAGDTGGGESSDSRKSFK
jgi:hypothetical protein